MRGKGIFMYLRDDSEVLFIPRNVFIMSCIAVATYFGCRAAGALELPPDRSVDLFFIF